jgi:DNA (cytosine-5)-methyltransferase 1
LKTKKQTKHTKVVKAAARTNVEVPRRSPLTFIDVFAGCGGLSLGLMQAGWQGLFAIEHDVNAFQTLRANLLDIKNKHRFRWPVWLSKEPVGVADVLVNNRKQLNLLSGNVDMLVGGPPCQGFSSAGKRNPADPRNRLVEQYLEFVNIIKPRIVLIENVRGIAADFNDEKSQSGKTNYANWIKDELSRNYIVASQMIDTSKFGVPQKRHRFFIVALLKGSGFEGAHPFQIIENQRTAFLKKKGILRLPTSSKSAISDLEISKTKRSISRDTVGFLEITHARPSTKFQRAMHLGHKGKLSDTRLAKHKPEIVFRFRKLIKFSHAEDRLNVSLSSVLRTNLGLKKNAIRVLDPHRPSPTITSMPDDLIHYSEPRTLTVRENARLQAFPDWFEFKGKYTTGGERRRNEVPRFTQVANAVPPLLAEAIGKALKTLANSNDS